MKIPVIFIVKAADYFNTCGHLGETDYRVLSFKAFYLSSLRFNKVKIGAMALFDDLQQLQKHVRIAEIVRLLMVRIRSRAGNLLDLDYSNLLEPCQTWQPNMTKLAELLKIMS